MRIRCPRCQGVRGPVMRVCRHPLSARAVLVEVEWPCEQCRGSGWLVVADSPHSNRLVSLAHAERRHVVAVLAACGGSVAQAARVLEIARGTLYDKLRVWREERCA